MAAPQSGSPTQGYYNQDQDQSEPYGEQPQPDYEEGESSVQGGPPNASGAAARRKRQYAGQAYEFGTGANAALGGQQPGGVAYPAPPPAGPGYGGYGQQAQQPAYQQPAYQQPAYQQPAYGDGPAAPAQVRPSSYGQPPPGVGGYQPPEAGYPTQGAPPPQSAMSNITHGMNSLGFGGQQQQPPQQMPQRPHLNQLFPSDLLNQPFNVSELDVPPPPIVLPQNVSQVFKSGNSHH